MAGPQSRVFFRRHMDRSSREVGQPAGVVRVAVREDDVRHVRSPEAEPLDLSGGRQTLVELEPGRVDGGLADPLKRTGDVLQTDARVDEREAAIVFE